MRSTRTDDRDVAPELRKAIERTGYYPEVVHDAVASAVAGEQVVSFYVHHEPTFEHDEVRRHQSVVVLTPTRLLLAHTDEHAGDDLLPEPYTSTSTEAISLAAVKSVVVTRMVTNPTKGPSRPRAATTPAATPTTATPGSWPPTTSRCASRPPPTGRTRSWGCSPSPSSSAPGPSPERAPGGGLPRARLRRAVAG